MTFIDKLTVTFPSSGEIQKILKSKDKKLRMASISLDELTWLLLFKKKKWLFEAVDLLLPTGVLRKILKSKEKNINAFFIDILEKTANLQFNHLIAGLSMPLSKNLNKNLKRLIPNFKSISNISRDMILAYPKESQILLKKIHPQVVLLKSGNFLKKWIESSNSNILDINIHFFIFANTLDIYASSIRRKIKITNFCLKLVKFFLKLPFSPFYLYTFLVVYFTRPKGQTSFYVTT